jgi:F-type H+-transporting ATPase subunit b
MDGETWVAVGIVIFVLILLWKRVPAMVGAQLDTRAAIIAKELEEAARLRQEAQEILADYKKKQSLAEPEALAILADARANVERYAQESRAQLDAQIARRAKQAQDKIAQAEAQAVAEVRAIAADAAIAAAEKIIVSKLNDERSKALVQDSLKGLGGKLN